MPLTRPLPILLLALAAACGRGAAPPDPTSDIDGDGILDVHEGMEDPDGDGIPNAGDEDSDGDGYPDAVERGDDDPLTLPVDTDGDRIPDFLDLDSDGNGLPDAEETTGGQPRPDTDGDGILDPHDVDDDGDGVPDVLEGAAEWLDTDGDGDPDRVDLDSDDDGILDQHEGLPLVAGAPYDHDQDGIPDSRDLDSDGDTLADADERGEETDPRDTDGDGRADFRDRDSDNDGLADDDDYLLADPLSEDADGDGVRDGTEVELGTDPRDAQSVPAEPLYVVQPRLDVEELRSLSVDVGRRRVDVYFLLRGQNVIPGKHSEISRTDHVQEVVTALGEVLDAHDPEVAVGLGLYFARSHVVTAQIHESGNPTFGAHVPLLIPTRGAADIGPAIARWDDLQNAWPADGALMAIHQALTGEGYDMNCDGVFQPSADVKPWRASPADLFGGTSGSLATDLRAPPGRLAGMGRRPFAMPVLLLEPNGMSDPDGLGGAWATWPCDGCPEPTSAEIATELQALGGQLVVFDVEGLYQDGAPGELVRDLVDIFDAYADLDMDGDRDDPLIVRGAQLDSELALANLTEDLRRIIQHAIASRDFDRVDFKVVGDEHGLVQRFDPPSIDIPEGGTGKTSVTLTFRGVVPPAATDQVIRMELVAAGDGVVSLGSQPFIVVVPGRGLD